MKRSKVADYFFYQDYDFHAVHIQGTKNCQSACKCYVPIGQGKQIFLA